ncbi:MAG: MBL fold metallo-hydrolase [Pseudomonadota bacterium]
MTRPKHHLPNGCFRNNAELDNHTSLLKVLRWQWQSPRVERQCFPVTTDDHHRLHEDGGESRLTWIGHATFLIQHGGLHLLTDPVFSKRASPSQAVGPKRTTPPGVALAALPRIDAVLISHDHYDHLDRDSVRALCAQQAGDPPLFVVPLKLGRWLSAQGIHHWVELDWWDSHHYRGWHFHAVPVQHFSGRGPRPNNTLWAGFVAEAPAGNGQPARRFFFAGDSGYSDDFKAVGERFGPLDIALLPIGAYAPRWFMRDMHMSPEEAVEAHIDLGARRSIAMHWGTFVLTDEPMDEPPKRLRAALGQQNLGDREFRVLQHGELLSEEHLFGD